MPKRHKEGETDVEELVECEALERHLRKVLLVESKNRQIIKSIPQRGLIYEIEKDIDEQTMVLVGYFKNAYQLNWIETNCMYNARAGLDAGSIALSEDMINAKYLLLFHPKIGTRFYKLLPGGPIAIAANDKQLKEVEGYKPSKPVYLAFRFIKQIVPGFEDYDWNKQEFVSYLRPDFKPHTIPLSELKRLLKK